MILLYNEIGSQKKRIEKAEILNVPTEAYGLPSEDVMKKYKAMMESKKKK